MNKIILTIIALLSINFVQAESIFSNNQEQEEQGVNFFESNQTEADNPGNGGIDGDDYSAPIDDYAPLLVLGAVALGFYTRKKLM